MTRTILTPVFAGSLLTLACSYDPSRELVAARYTYEDAEKGPAGNVAKSEVYEAKKALARAERAHFENSGSAEEVDLSYVALRKADYAIAYADFLEQEKQAEKAKAAYLETLEQQKTTAEQALDAKEKSLAESMEARRMLEQKLSSTMSDLADMAKLKQEGQRTIITLNGAVLFKSNDTQLLPIAQDRLGQVADALKQYGDDYKITVVGHTDSRGTTEHNRMLSEARAEAVKNFLVTKGVDTEMRSLGMGESQPVASNKYAEGRGNNRRVEIVVEPKPGKGPNDK